MKGTEQENKRWAMLEPISKAVEDAAREYRNQSEAATDPKERESLRRAFAIDLEGTVYNALTEVFETEHVEELCAILCHEFRGCTTRPTFDRIIPPHIRYDNVVPQ